MYNVRTVLKRSTMSIWTLRLPCCSHHNIQHHDDHDDHVYDYDYYLNVNNDDYDDDYVERLHRRCRMWNN